MGAQVSSIAKDASEKNGKGDKFNQQKLSAFFDRLQQAEDAKNETQARIKGIYDEAEKAGFNRKALKIAFSHIKSPKSAEDRAEANSYLEAHGQLPLFANIEKH